MTCRAARILGLVFLAASATAALAQQPRVSNARLETRAAGAGLEREFRALAGAQSAPGWIGYAVPLVAGRHEMCCHSGDHCCGACTLEATSFTTRSEARATGPVQLEQARNLLVLFRVETGKVVKLRTFSEDCELDAGGLPVYWLTGVRPVESIRLLSGFATGSDAIAAAEDSRHSGRLSDNAVSAIALHADAAADGALDLFVAASQPEALRRRAVFWLGVARGARGLEALRRLIREDSSDKVRERAVFALSVSKEPGAVDTIIQTARNDRSAHVRGQALFWLGQKAGRKAAETITDAIANDPETEVKRRAVFALSQLPKDESIPLLMQIARTNRNPEVRKQAIFWLGQSKDPRALAFFEQILTR